MRKPRPKYDFSKYFKRLRKWSPGRGTPRTWKVLSAIQKHQTASPVELAKLTGMGRESIKDTIHMLRTRNKIPIPYLGYTGKPPVRINVPIRGRLTALTPVELKIWVASNDGRKWLSAAEIRKEFNVGYWSAQTYRKSLQRKLAHAGIAYNMRLRGRAITRGKRTIYLSPQEARIYDLVKAGVKDRKEVSEMTGMTLNRVNETMYSINYKLAPFGIRMPRSREMPTLEQVQAEVSRTGGNWAEAARNLGVHYQTLQKAMRKQGFGRKQPFAEKGTRPGIRYETVGYGGQYHRLPPREATVLKAVKEHRTTDAAALSQLLGLEPRKIQMAMETLRRRRGIPVRPEKGTMTVTATIEGRKVITAITEEKLARLRDRVLSGRLPMHLLRMELRKKLKETYPEIRKALKEGKISESG